MKTPTLRYRVRTVDGGPPPGSIIMGVGRRVRRAYRVISIARGRNGKPMLGFITWRVKVEHMSVQRGREEIAAGAPHWPIYWDRRMRRKISPETVAVACNPTVLAALVHAFDEGRP